MIRQAVQELVAHSAVLTQIAHGILAQRNIVVDVSVRNTRQSCIEHVRCKRRWHVVGLARELRQCIDRVACVEHTARITSIHHGFVVHDLVHVCRTDQLSGDIVKRRTVIKHQLLIANEHRRHDVTTGCTANIFSQHHDVVDVQHHVGINTEGIEIEACVVCVTLDLVQCATTGLVFTTHFQHERIALLTPAIGNTDSVSALRSLRDTEHTSQRRSQSTTIEIADRSVRYRVHDRAELAVVVIIVQRHLVGTQEHIVVCPSRSPDDVSDVHRLDFIGHLSKHESFLCLKLLGSRYWTRLRQKDHHLSDLGFEVMRDRNALHAGTAGIDNRQLFRH